MRIILFFDLPIETRKNRSDYRHFVKDLKKEGYFMFQKSVYVKMTLDQNKAISSINLIKKICPNSGNIAALIITEKEFQEINLILGEIETDIINSTERTISL